MTVRQASLQSPSLVQQHYGREGGGAWSEAVMLHEKFPSRPNWRFHSASISATFAWLRIADEMTQEIASDSHEKDTAASVRVRPRARDYFWRPWYAKLWWAAIPLYWIVVADPTRPTFIDPLVRGGYTAITNIVFLPMTAILVLGFRFFGGLLDRQAQAFDAEFEVGTYRPAGYPHPTIDEFDPASGPRWIGNRHRDELIP
ncbi:hypothetical protein PX554_06320 [Sphingomonas sp. H39-1-10]|uniref:hypothetical protein n=1 Tax=Sphingomonas pollutisoli TaxID=3030829 RepID=UPI0023B978BE|nr:hypothetical protein [Sphingomonas pollutisoli]MDF0487738.1 hypothetical protein [Sphingomonas pollutisoli]